MRTVKCGSALGAAMILAGSAFTAPCAIAADDPAERKKVDEVFADVARPESPGCALAVDRDGKIIYAKGDGLANIKEGVATTPKTVFDIGSTSKKLNSASIFLQENQGKLSVNDNVAK